MRIIVPLGKPNQDGFIWTIAFKGVSSPSQGYETSFNDAGSICNMTFALCLESTYAR